MSDAVSLSLSPALAESLVGATTVPQTFRFAKQRWQSAILSLLGSVAMSASGVFLLTEIPKTQNLQIQMAIMGTLLTLGGIALLSNVYRDVFGTLTVDQEGVRLSPAYAGFSIRWSDLERWAVKDSVALHTKHPTIRFWGTGAAAAHAFPASFLSTKDQHRLRQLLQLGSPQA